MAGICSINALRDLASGAQSSESLPKRIDGVMFSLAGSFPAMFSMQLYWAIAPKTDGSRGGALAQLGAGSKRVSASQMKSLARWPYLLAPLAVGLAAVFFFSSFFIVYEFWKNPPDSATGLELVVMYPLVLYICAALTIGIPSMIGWCKSP